MKMVVFAMVGVMSLMYASSTAAQGNVEVGRKLWAGNTLECNNCHGTEGQGGFGPDLAGRRLSFEQFRHAVRTPWGIMPAYIEKQISDQDMMNLVAHFDSLPRVAQPGPWRTPVPAGAPPAQQLLIATYGCGQCHGPVFDDSRGDAGAAGADYAWFANLVYNHTTASPEERRLSGDNPDNPIRMGNFSRTRVPESSLQQIWNYVSMDLGLRVPMRGRFTAGVPAGSGTTYTLNVENTGIAGKGRTAEDLTISLMLPPGVSVISTTGAGYQGLRRDAQAGTDVAVWTLARMAPTDRQTYSITLSAPSPASGTQRLRGTIQWSKPALGDRPRDTANIPPPPAS
jgi:mono/diheme cytochrome c family protein